MKTAKPSGVCKITTSNRRSISSINNKQQQQETNFELLPCDIDNHSDTTVAGSNFVPIFFTSQTCTVTPFSTEYNAINDIQICSAATMTTLPTGEKVILIFGQSLWFGNRMERSLINPNQCRAYGIKICDDPTDTHRNLGIEIGDDFIPMQMRGTICCFESYCPTNDQIETYRKIVLSDEEKWDPNANIFMQSSREGERDKSVKEICRIESIISSKMSIDVPYEYDRMIGSINVVHSEFLVDSLVANITVESRKMTISSTFSSRRHSEFSAEEVSRKWSISLRRAKTTLGATTQHNCRTALMPLSKRYRTNLISQFKRIRCKLFTDTLFHSTK